jgi:hypothetical protein
MVFNPLETPFYLCSDCSDSIREKNEKVIQSSIIKGNCSICGSRFGRKTIYNSKFFKEVDKDKAEEILNWMEESAELIIEEHPDEVIGNFLIEIPKEKLKGGIVRITHFRYGHNSYKCLCEEETIGRLKKKKFTVGDHGVEYCPHLQVSRLKRRQ